MSDNRAPQQEAGPMREKPGRYRRSTGGMIGSLIVLVVVMAIFVAFRGLVRDQPQVEVEPVDYRTAAGFAREQAPFVLAPRELPEGWVATSARFTPGEDPAWSLGTLTDDEVYVGLHQAVEDLDDLIERHVGEDAEPDGEVTIEGERWQRWTDTDDDLALAREGDGAATVVVGRVSQETLEELLATLE